MAAATGETTMGSDRGDLSGHTSPAPRGSALRVAIAGKGGSGKTTIAGTLARLLAGRGRDVVAVDADTNPNLASTLGIAADRAREITSLPRTLLQRETQPDGTVKSTFARDPLEVLAEYGATAPDGVRLVVIGAVGHAGAG
jgi:CO dehydrogenase maturation factor